MAKILVIDDDVDLLETLEDALSGPDVTVVTRDNAQGAVGAAMSERPDLIILDVMFPEDPAAGFDLARAMRGTPELERVPIILLTAINREFPGDLSSDDMGGDWFPVQALIEKPVDLDILRSRVAELLAGA